MIVWVIFGIQVLILIISGLKKGFLKNELCNYSKCKLQKRQFSRAI